MRHDHGNTVLPDLVELSNTKFEFSQIKINLHMYYFDLVFSKQEKLQLYLFTINVVNSDSGAVLVCSRLRGFQDARFSVLRPRGNTK